MKTKIYNILFEQDTMEKDAPEATISAPDTTVKSRLALDSVDDQIDALILQYEKKAIRDEEDEEDSLSESLNSLSLRMLLEQEEEEETPEMEIPDSGVDPGGDAPADDEQAPEDVEPEGSEKMTVDEPAESQIIPDLDIDNFTSRVVRLIMNHKNLLRIEEAIINRVKNFLDENYGDVFVRQYLDILESQYGIKYEEFDVDYLKDEEFAIGAYAGGTGGLGGGGGG